MIVSWSRLWFDLMYRKTGKAVVFHRPRGDPSSHLENED